MKLHKFILPILILALSALTACEDKHDCNGDLDGLWQLIEWRDANDSVIATKGSFYYSFQLNVMKLQNGNNPDKTLGDASNYFLSHFNRQGESIVLSDIVTYGRFQIGTKGYPSDTLIAKEDTLHKCLEKGLGVPSNNKYLIELLNDDKLILKSDGATLTFRKY